MEVNKLVFRMKTTITFGLVQKAALNVVEAALRRSRNCTLLLVAKAAHAFTNLSVTDMSIGATSPTRGDKGT